MCVFLQSQGSRQQIRLLVKAPSKLAAIVAIVVQKEVSEIKAVDEKVESCHF